MNQKKKLFILILLFALLIGGASVLYSRLGAEMAPDQLVLQQTVAQSEPSDTHNDVEEEAKEPNRVMAPDFTVYDLDGNEVKLSDYYGKPIVLNFWASWCGPCQMEMPDFNEKHLEQGEDITFLMVNMTDGARETVEGASAFVAERDYAFPVFFDTEMDAAAAYGVNSLPTTYFIDADGYAIAQARGAINSDALQRGIDLIA